MGAGDLGAPIESPSTQFDQMPSASTTYQAHPSMIQLLLVVRLTGPTSELLALPACSLARYLQGMGLGDFGVTIETPATQFDQMLSAATTYWANPLMIELLLVLRLTGPTGQFLAVPVCFPGWHLQGMGPREFEVTYRITGDPA